MNPPDQPTPALAPTPRTDTEEQKTTQRYGCFMVKSGFARTLETELAAAKAECEELLSVNATGAERLRFVLEENSRLRAEVERLEACTVDSEMYRETREWAEKATERAKIAEARAEKAEADLKYMQSSALTWARFAGDKAACADIAEQCAQITERLWKEFITLMEITEESDSGNEFRPNKISSCRAMDGKRLNEILAEARRIVF
jgi:hypothetical protein